MDLDTGAHWRFTIWSMLRLWTTLLLIALPGLLQAGELKPDQEVQGHFRVGASAPEFSAPISAGETVRFTVEQGNSDLAVTVTMPDGLTLRSDQFQFGPENITVMSSIAGAVHLVVDGAKAGISTADFKISRTASLPSTQHDEDESAAEALATKAKTGAAEKSPDSLSNLTAAIDAWKTLGDPSAVARTRLARGDWYFSRSDWENARGDYRLAIEECAFFLRCSAEAINNAGTASLNLGDIDDAAAQFSAASDAWRQLGLPQLQARTVSNLGLLHYQTSDYALALADFATARRLLAPSRPLFLATVLNNTGLVYLALERYSDAVSYFSQALSVALLHPDGTKVQGRIRINMGHVHMLAGMLPAALRDEEAALRLADSNLDVSGKADSLDNAGQIYYHLHKLPAAESAFRQALALYLKIGSPRGLSSARFYLGLLAAERRAYDEARIQLELALDIRLSRRLQNEAAETYYELAVVEKTRENRDAALAFAEKAANMAENLRVQAAGASSRRTLFGARRKYFEFLIEEILGNSITGESAAAAFRVAERARAQSLADSMYTIPPEHRGTDSAFSVERRALWRQISFKSARLAAISVNQPNDEEVRSLRNDIENLLLADDQLAASKTSLADSGQHTLPPGSLAELRNGFLADTDVFLEYWLGEKKSFLWVIRGDDVDVRELPPRRRIEARVQSLLSLLTDINGRRADPKREDSFQFLRRQLSRDLNIVLNSPAPSRTVIVADGTLNRVPFALLPLSLRSDSGAMQLAGSVGLVAPIVQAPSAAVFMALSQRGRAAHSQSAVAFGDPVYNSDDDRVGPAVVSSGNPRHADVSGLSLSRLAFSRIEMNTVAEVVPKANRKLISGADATREQFLSGAQNADGLLLVSTHILPDDDQPDLSSIVFSMVDSKGRPIDGLVHLYDLNNGALRLRSALVALSACDGAGGRKVDGEGLQSLALGFILAGARGVVASVSAVDSEGAAYFMRSFLQSLLGAGGSPADSAIYRARRSMAASMRWRDPYYWSTFALIAGA